MTIVKSDDKRRVRLGDVGPGEAFQVTRPDEDHWLLTRLSPPPPPKPMSRAQIKQAMREHRLQLNMSWEELRTLTREP